jgi:hypothetical protein
MRYGAAVLLLAARALSAQTGQEGPRPEWPCVPGRAVDPAYLETSESTGGQLFLFQKGEVAQAGPVMSASYTHPATIVRAVGTLSGSREFEFPVDSTVESLLVLVSLRCRSAIGVFRPNGAEMIAANSAQSLDLQAGKILRIDNPEPGAWKLRLAGSGLFVLSVLAQSPIHVSGVTFLNPTEDPPAPHRQPRLGASEAARISVSGEVTGLKFLLAGASGEALGAGAIEPQSPERPYSVPFTLSWERFRVRMTGVDASGWPVLRTYPVLFRAQPN